ncbi:ImpA family metalloprotease [Massilia eburnea]|nr:ImpA family metalloprotease [Massilia eburnea]
MARLFTQHSGLRATIPLLFVAATLYGCGGGGGNGSDTAGAPGTGTSNPGTPPGPTTSALEVAMSSGNSSNVTLPTVLTAAQSLLSTQVAAYADVRQAISSNVGNIDWDPSHDSAYFTLQDAARNHLILPSNWKYNGATAGTGVALGIAGNTPVNNTRYAAFGGNPIGVPGNAEMDKLMANTVGWLSAAAAAPATFKVVVAQVPGTESYWFPHEKKVRDWFYAKYQGVTINGQASTGTQADDACDGAALAGCLQGANLLVIGSDQGKNYSGDTVLQAVSAAQARGIPVLYLNHNRDANDLATRLSTYFGLAHNSNYWGQEGLKAFAPASLPTQPAKLASIQALLTRLEQGTFSTTWSGCGTSSPVNCDGDATYMSEFGTQAAQIRTTMRQFDANGTRLFDQAGYQLEKLLVLLGDKYRENVSYPMDKTVNEQDFFRAYFSDATAYINRDSSAVAKNLGNFATMIPAATPTISQTVTVTLPTSGTREYLTGLYVIPGRKVTLTRTDGGTGTVKFGLNMLRDTTREFDKNLFDRPTQISSPRAALAANKAVSITSPYGGPLMLFIDAAASGSQTVTVQVDGVVTHPVLRNPNDPTAVAAFAAEVNSTVTNWVGFATDTLTLHSTLDHFKTTMASYNGDMAALASDTFKYTVKDTYELAGFNSSSGQLSLASAVTSFCNSKGWDCTGTQHRRDTMQHVISDVHALCGDGCSGNPYDQDWAFNPLGWGESHEIGHNIQPGRLKIYGGQSTEVSNNIFPMHKQMKFNLTAAGLASPIIARPNTGAAVFNDLKAALGTADPVTAMYNSTWSDTSYAANNSARVMFYRQLVEYARYYNPQFPDGWDLVTLLYLLDRDFGQAASTWATKATGFGFGAYAAYPGSISGNDFMLIATSNIIGRDMGPMFALWGITTSSEAKAQVAAYGYTAVQQLYFPMNYLSATPAKVGAPIVMTATATYPAGY